MSKGKRESMGSEVSIPVCVGAIILIAGAIYIVGTYVPMAPLPEQPIKHYSLQEAQR